MMTTKTKETKNGKKATKEEMSVKLKSRPLFDGRQHALDLEQVSSGAEWGMSLEQPYIAVIQLTGTSPLLMHNWNIEEIESKQKSKKGSTERKTDNIESFAYRDENGNVGVPSKCLIAALADAGRYIPDPRSPRKSCRDLVKGGIQSVGVVSPF